MTDVPCSPELEMILQAILKIWAPSMAFLSIIDSQSVWTARQDGESLTIAAWGKHPDEKEIPLPPRWTMLEATRVTPIPDVTFFSYPRLRGSLDWQNMSQAILSIKARLFKSCLVAPLLDNEGVQVGCVGFVTSSPRTFDSGDCRMMANIAELAVREMELIKERTKDTTPGVALDLTVGEAADFGGFASRVNTSSTGAGVLLRPVNPSQVVASFDEDLGDQAHVTSPTTNAKNINKDFADSVILLVDTRTIDWTVLYASSSLAPLTGIAPDVAIGLAINTLFVGSSKAGGDGDGSGSTSIILEGLRAEAEAGKAFVMQQAHIRRDKVPSRPSLSEEKPKNIYNTFMLSFKPGALGPLDSQAALWDIPPGLPPPKSERLLGLYFARVYLVNERQDLGELAGGHTRSQSSILSSMAMTDERTHQTLQINPLLGISVLFEGLTPISVLGQGALGTVYKCTWVR